MMMHTKEGASAVNMMLAHSGAKQRKGVVKALKGQIARVSQDDYAHVVIAALFDCVDDTQLLSKGVVNELKQEGLEEVASHKNARRVLLHILNPRSTRYFPPHLLECIPDPVKVREDAEETVAAMKRGSQAEKDANKAVGKELSDDERDEDDDMGIIDDEFDAEGEADEADEEEDDDDADDLEEAYDGPDFGIAKKPANTRRAELFRQGLGDALITTCSVNACAMLRSNLASDVLFEVAAGGGVTTSSTKRWARRKCLSSLRPYRKRCTSRCRKKSTKNLAKSWSPCTQTFSPRARFAAWRWKSSTKSFVPTFWKTALKGDLKTWIDGHGAKVVAAIVRTDTDAKTRKAIHTAVGKLVDGGDPVAWSEGFFRKTEPEQA